MIMGAVTENFDIRILQKTWGAFDHVAHLRPIRNDEEYDRPVALMNNLLDVVGDDKHHVLSGLLALVSELVGDYDAGNFAIEASELREILRYLIERVASNRAIWPRFCRRATCRPSFLASARSAQRWPASWRNSSTSARPFSCRHEKLSLPKTIKHSPESWHN